MEGKVSHGRRRRKGGSDGDNKANLVISSSRLWTVTITNYQNMVSVWRNGRGGKKNAIRKKRLYAYDEEGLTLVPLEV